MKYPSLGFLQGRLCVCLRGSLSHWHETAPVAPTNTLELHQTSQIQALERKLARPIQISESSDGNSILPSHCRDELAGGRKTTRLSPLAWMHNVWTCQVSIRLLFSVLRTSTPCFKAWLPVSDAVVPNDNRQQRNGMSPNLELVVYGI